MPDISLAQAKSALNAALAAGTAADMQALGIVVLDSGGHPVAFARQDGATMLRFDIARAKAWSALALGSSSRAYQEMADTRPNFAASLNAITEGSMAASAGGLLLEHEGKVIGAIGVSGDLPDNDEVAAKAGQAAI